MSWARVLYCPTTQRKSADVCAESRLDVQKTIPEGGRGGVSNNAMLNILFYKA